MAVLVRVAAPLSGSSTANILAIPPSESDISGIMMTGVSSAVSAVAGGAVGGTFCDVTSIGRSGAASIAFPIKSDTAPASMSSCGTAIG